MNWPVIEKKIFGIRLPSIVSVAEPEKTSWVIHLASRTHRVDGIRLVEKAAVDGEGVPMPILPMSTLRNLPVEGSTERVGSFFYTSGFRKGHVRGAFSPIEGLTAGLLLLDPMLGMDKDFGDPGTTGTRFYTGLLPWQRNTSRLDRFDPLLRSLGFRLHAQR